jgi:hypothetical protein
MNLSNDILNSAKQLLYVLGKAFAEVFVVTIFGIFPFLLAVLRYNTIQHPQAGIDIIPVFQQSFSGGQLFLYAFSLLGTLLWLAFFNWTTPIRLHRWLLGLIVLVVGFVLVGLGGIDPTFSTIQNPAIVSLSFWCYGAYTVIYFLLLLEAKQPPPPAGNTFKADAEKLKEKLKGLEAQT